MSRNTQAERREGAVMDGHCCSMLIGDELLVWSVERLWESARDLPVESVPLRWTGSIA
jgi:hypothetical protein